MITSSSATTHQIQEYTAKSTLQIVMLIAPRIQFQTHTAKNRVPPYSAKNTSSIKYRWLQCTDQWPPCSAYISIATQWCIYMHHSSLHFPAVIYASASALQILCWSWSNDPCAPYSNTMQLFAVQCSSNIYDHIGVDGSPACQSFWGKNREKDRDK